MAEHFQQLGWSQESGETNLHDDWTCLAPSINEILKEDHLKAAIESLDTDADAVPLTLSDNLENYLEPENQTNSLQMVSDVAKENLVLGRENISTVRKESNTDHDSDTDELNLSYNANSCSQVSQDVQEDAQIHVTTVVSHAYVEQDSRNVASPPKDQDIEANSLQINHTENFAINSIRCDKPQHRYDSDTLSLNSPAVALNTEELKDTEISCSPAKSENIQKKLKYVDDSSHVWTAEKNGIATKPNTTEERMHCTTSVKYKPQFGNKKRKHPLPAEASADQSKVETSQTDSAEDKTPATKQKAILVSERIPAIQGLVENGSTTITDETAVTEDNIASHFSPESINVKTVVAATSDKNNKDSSVTNESTSAKDGNALLSINKTAKCKNKTVKIKGKPSKCENGTNGNEPVQRKIKSSKTTELTSRKVKNSTKSDCESVKRKEKASKEGQNSAVASKSSQETEQNSSGIKRFLEQQEKLARARNLLRSEQQKNESKCIEMCVANVEDTSKDTKENTYKEKLKAWDSEVSLLETLIEQVKSLTEGEEDPEKCFSLFENIREKVSASLLLKYPVLVAILEPIQRYESDERIKQEAEDIYKKFNSMYIKQNMEDFVFAFNKTLKLHLQHLSKSERLAKKILKRILPSDEIGNEVTSGTDVTFDIEMWNNLAKERNSVWERFVQEFQEPTKTTVHQAASGSSSPTSNIKEEDEEMNNDFDSTDLNTKTQEQQETRKLPSCNRTTRMANRSSLMSNPRRAQTIVKPEHGLDDDANVKPDPDEMNASKKHSFRIKEEIVMDTETLYTNTEMQRKQPTRSCKTPKIKEEVSSDEPIIRIKQEFDYNAETVNTKKAMQKKQTQRSSKNIKIEEVISPDEQIVRVKEEIDSDMDIQNRNREFQRIQPRRSCNPNKEKLELRMHFAKRKSNFNKEKNETSKKAKVSE